MVLPVPVEIEQMQGRVCRHAVKSAWSWSSYSRCRWRAAWAMSSVLFLSEPLRPLCERAVPSCRPEVGPKMPMWPWPLMETNGAVSVEFCFILGEGLAKLLVLRPGCR